MRSLKDIYKPYAGRVAFLGIDVDPSESADLIRSYATRQGYAWEMAPWEARIVGDYRVTTQATKIVIDEKGTIVFRAGYGVESPETWKQVLEDAAGL